MTFVIQPDLAVLPSRRQLTISAIFAAIAGVIVVLVAVIPAELGLDPTGLGRPLGLTQIGESKRLSDDSSDAAVAESVRATPLAPMTPAAPAAPVSPAAPAPTTLAIPAAPPASPAPPAPVAAVRSDEVTLTLVPSQGAEVKLVMKAGDEIEYTWSTDRGRVNFDFHGDSSATPREPSRKYERGAQAQAEGKFVAPFAGTHGWYWRNRTTVTLNVTLRTRGTYEKLIRLE